MVSHCGLDVHFPDGSFGPSFGPFPEPTGLVSFRVALGSEGRPWSRGGVADGRPEPLQGGGAASKGSSRAT